MPSFELALDEEFEKEFGAPFIDIHRAYLHRALSDAVGKNDGDTIRLNKRLVNLSEDTDQVRLEFEDSSVEEAD